MGKEQEYLYNNEYVTIWGEVKDHPDLCIVSTDHEGLVVANRANLQKKEDSWGYKRALERKAELENVTKKAEENLDAVVEKVIAKACKALKSRMKMNILFSDGMNSGGWGLAVANELDKLIKEDAKDIVKDDKDIFS